MPFAIFMMCLGVCCITHSLGTKGDNGAPLEANVSLSIDSTGNQVATVHLPEDQRDIDEAYSILFKELSNPPKRKKPAQVSQEDYFRIFRTRVILFWILSNTTLIAMFTVPELTKALGINTESEFNPFLTFFLWSVASMAFVRFVGSVTYRISRGKKRMSL
jgi:chitin synthase